MLCAAIRSCRLTAGCLPPRHLKAHEDCAQVMLGGCLLVQRIQGLPLTQLDYFWIGWILKCALMSENTKHFRSCSTSIAGSTAEGTGTAPTAAPSTRNNQLPAGRQLEHTCARPQPAVAVALHCCHQDREARPIISQLQHCLWCHCSGQAMADSASTLKKTNELGWASATGLPTHH
jgi:hypothetical protein